MRAKLAIPALSLTLGALSPVSAEIFHSRESALRLAFPDADSVSVRDLVLSRADSERVADLAGVPVESRLVSVYEGFQAGERTGWAFLDTHPVRTLPETLLLALEPDGRIRATHLLAFHEPREYGPSARWLDQFAGGRLDPELAVGRGIAGIGGSTLTAQAVTAAVRRLLAVWQVELGGLDPPASSAEPLLSEGAPPAAGGPTRTVTAPAAPAGER